MRRTLQIVMLTCAVTAGIGLGLMSDPLLRVFKRGSQAMNIWDQTDQGTWPGDFRVVSIDSVGGGLQSAMFLPSNGTQPLVVSLHTWSGNYAQNDPLAEGVLNLGWNYIRPDMRGPNNTPESCLSEIALSDFDQAITFALQNGNVDDRYIYVVGASGGGYAALGAYLRSRQPVTHYFAWVPITDLEAWYYQSVAKGTRYATDIVECTESDGVLDAANARERSPLHWPVYDEWEPRPLSLFAGIDDGHTGSVPISHSIDLFNRFATHLSEDGIDGSTAASLLTRALPPTDHTIADRSVFLQRSLGPIDITIFQGGHEMLVEYQLQRLVERSQ